ncbi:MAG: CRISPR-associated endonuclease Cas1 [Hyphomonadaceae bacterium]
MPTAATLEPESADDVDQWADRCRYWAEKADGTPPRKRRERRTEPLVLTGHGLSLRVDRGCLFVRGGKTHYPTELKELRFFKGGLDIPPRIISLDGSGIVSLDALDWMAEQGTTFVRINFDGSHSMVMSPSGYSANLEKVSWQLETRDNPKRKLAFAREITDKKLKAALHNLENLFPKSEKQIAAIETTKKTLAKIRIAKSHSELLGLEGSAAYPYWMVWRGITLNWKSQSRFPIPEIWKTFHERSSLLSGEDRANKRATNPINAMLNYAYAVLLTEMRIKAITDGYDPTIGILHDKRVKRELRTSAFALDLMEPLRPVVDRAVLKLVAEETFSGADFQLQSDGVCRLNPELARTVARSAASLI